MKFNDTSRKFALEVLAHLGSGPLGPAGLVERTGASRAKVMRMLSYLEDTGVIVKTKTGPKAQYSKPTAMDLHAMGAEVPPVGAPVITLSFLQSDALLLAGALDNLSRYGLGQWGVFAEGLRWCTLLPNSVTTFDYAEQEEFESAVNVLKGEALGFGAGASWGIHGPGTHSSCPLLWRIYKAISHRISWDQNPAGGMGVNFDEPLKPDASQGVAVHSVTQGDDTRVCLTLPVTQVIALGIALETFTNLAKGNLELLLDVSLTGICPKPSQGHRADPERVAAALARVKNLLGLKSPQDELPLTTGSQRIAAIAQGLKDVLLDKSLDAGDLISVDLPEVAEMATGDKLLPVLKGFPKGVVQAIKGASLAKLGPLKLAIQDIPEGVSLGKDASGYRVLKLDKEAGCMVVVKTSQSLQTAVCMLKNVAQNTPPRDFGW